MAHNRRNWTGKQHHENHEECGLVGIDFEFLDKIGDGHSKHNAKDDTAKCDGVFRAEVEPSVKNVRL